MKVGVFIQNCSPESGGASTLQQTILKEIISDRDEEIEYIFYYYGSFLGKSKFSKNGIVYVNLNYYKFIRIKDKIASFIYGKILRQNIQPKILNFVSVKEKIDLVWFTFPANYYIECPYIYTIWDLGHRTTPFFPEVSRTGWLWNDRESTYQNMVYRASYIITGNEEGKKEILENYPVNPKKIRIVPFPVADFCRGKELPPSFAVPKNFFFYPAQFWPHKNHIRILQAVKYLKEESGIDTTVFFTGSDKGNRLYIQNKIKEYGLKNNIFFTGFLKDEELKYLYTHATGMIFASLMGPNNMPPIEATFLNCPVIITDLDGHKEQLKDTALYFNGYNAEDLAENMKILLTDDSARIRIKQNQLSLSNEFDQINYFVKIKDIINEFKLIRCTWGDSYKHL